MGKLIDISNNKFGKLTVLERAGSDKGNALWKCICDCGNTIIVRGTSLRTGHTKSCGCLQKEKVKEQGIKNKKDLTGKRFGRLIVVEDTGKRSGEKIIWRCQCDCGNMVNVQGSNLVTGNTMSCGCLQSANEEKIIKILQKYNIEYKTQFSFNDLIGKQKRLRFDFALFKEDKLLCVIEYQGSQHTDINNPWHTELVEEYDEKKRKYCKENCIPLFELDRFDNLEERILAIYDRLPRNR